MQLTLEMQMDNEAFSADPGQEAARILRKLAEKLECSPGFSDGDSFRLMDYNGNCVGKADVELE